MMVTQHISNLTGPSNINTDNTLPTFNAFFYESSLRHKRLVKNLRPSVHNPEILNNLLLQQFLTQFHNVNAFGMLWVWSQGTYNGIKSGDL